MADAEMVEQGFLRGDDVADVISGKSAQITLSPSGENAIAKTAPEISPGASGGCGRRWSKRGIDWVVEAVVKEIETRSKKKLSTNDEIAQRLVLVDRI
jgi:hypothetical protein